MSKRSGHCVKCGTFRISLHRDHIIPRWKGGSDDPVNIQLLCANCHEDKTREDMRGRQHGPEERAKNGLAFKGKRHTLESRMKMSVANLGRKRSPETVAKLRAALAASAHLRVDAARANAAKARASVTREENLAHLMKARAARKCNRCDSQSTLLTIE